MTSKELMEKIVATLDDKKAQNIEVIKLDGVTTIADYFVICSGTSSTHAKTLADTVDEKINRESKQTFHKEGYQSASWVLLDFGDVVVHIFYGDTRAFYNLEHLWSDGEKIAIDNLIGGDRT